MGSVVTFIANNLFGRREPTRGEKARFSPLGTGRELVDKNPLHDSLAGGKEALTALPCKVKTQEWNAVLVLRPVSSKLVSLLLEISKWDLFSSFEP